MLIFVLVAAVVMLALSNGCLWFAWRVTARSNRSWKAKHDCAMKHVLEARRTVEKANLLVSSCNAEYRWPEVITEREQ